MLTLPSEMIQRIDANTEDVVDNVQGAQRELMKYWSRVSGNRWLVAKMFGVLMVRIPSDADGKLTFVPDFLSLMGPRCGLGGICHLTMHLQAWVLYTTGRKCMGGHGVRQDEIELGDSHFLNCPICFVHDIISGGNTLLRGIGIFSSKHTLRFISHELTCSNSCFVNDNMSLYVKSKKEDLQAREDQQNDPKSYRTATLIA